MSRQKTPTYLKDALRISELSNNLTNIAADDNRELKDFTLNEVLEEAIYILSCYNEDGHMLNEDLESDNITTKNFAQKQVRMLKNFIKKYQQQY